MRTCLLVLIALASTTLAGCGGIVTGPAFKQSVPKGGTYFGDVFSPTGFTNAAPVKVPIEGTSGFFVVSALDGSLYSYEGAQGKRREKRPWAKLPKGVRGTPVFDPTNKHLILGSYDRKVHALDMLSGAEHWFSPVDGYVQAPVALASQTAIVGTVRGTVYGIASIDGSQRWAYPLGGEVYGRAGVHPEWPHRAIVGNSRGNLALLDVNTGEALATFDAGAGLHGGISVAVLNSEVRAYFGTDKGEVECWDLTRAEAPARVWSTATGSAIWASPAIAPIGSQATTWAEVALYAPTIGSRMVAMRGGDGTELWNIELKPADRLHATPLIAGDYLYIGSLNHHLYCLNRSDGATVWEYEAFGEFRTAPLLDADRIIAVSNDHFLYALTWDTGQPLIGAMTLKPAPPVLDLTTMAAGATAESPLPIIDEAAIRAEVSPAIDALLDAVSAGDAARIGPFLANADVAQQAIYAAAVVERFKTFVIQQHEIRDVIPATAGDAVAIVNVSATDQGTPVRMVLTLRMLKDAGASQPWRVEPESLKPENVIQVPVAAP